MNEDPITEFYESTREESSFWYNFSIFVFLFIISVAWVAAIIIEVSWK